MTTVAHHRQTGGRPRTAQAVAHRPTPAHRAPPEVPGWSRPAVVLWTRLVRRGVAALVVAVAVYGVLEVQAFTRLYPDAASREMVTRFGDDPAVRILTGTPAGSSIGALVVWDNGWMVQILLAVWAAVTAARLLRDDEDTGRADLLLVRAPAPRAVLLVPVAVLVVAGVLVGATLGVTMAAAGTAVLGSALYAGQLAGVVAVHVALVAVLAQLAPRGRVLGTAGVVLLVEVLLRMVGNSADSRQWVHWLTPLGWNDRLAPYGADRGLVLLIPWTLTAALVALAVALRGRRDAGAVLLHRTRTPRSHRRGLRGPAAFAVRTSTGAFLAWSAGIVVFGAVAALMIPALEDFVLSDPGYAELLAAFGFDLADVTLGYVSMLGLLSALVLSLFAVWRVGAARTEEATGRLEQVLVRPVGRLRWLAGFVVPAAAVAVLASTVQALTVVGAARSVGAEVALTDALAASLNPLPAVAVALGLAVLLLGVAPRLVVPVGAGTVIALYLLELLGPALDWPEAVVTVSPFHHLASVPVEPWDAAGGWGLLAVGLVLTVAGALAFHRRDLQEG